jgi:hypothetical protein
MDQHQLSLDVLAGRSGGEGDGDRVRPQGEHLLGKGANPRLGPTVCRALCVSVVLIADSSSSTVSNSRTGTTVSLPLSRSLPTRTSLIQTTSLCSTRCIGALVRVKTRSRLVRWADLSFSGSSQSCFTGRSSLVVLEKAPTRTRPSGILQSSIVRRLREDSLRDCVSRQVAYPRFP